MVDLYCSQEKNSALTSSMRELSNAIGQLQAREQELLTKLKLKVCGSHQDMLEWSSLLKPSLGEKGALE